jgi:phosphoglycolate phosphatase-like HAD superfamily hydrolase
MGELLVLWDVDHTLIDAGGLSSHLYGMVFAELFGRELPRVAPMAGRTDRAIIVETLTMAGVASPRTYVPAFIEELTRRAPGFGEQVRARGRVLAGVPEALAALAGGLGGGGAGVGGAGECAGAGRAGGVRQSVLTGNIRPLAEVKLGALGLGDPLNLAIGAYGDMDEVRAGLVQVARERAAAAASSDAAGSGGAGSGGADFEGEATVLVGDTPLDVAAALATGARAVGVATGSFTEQELIAAGAHAVLPDLSDTARVRAAVLGSWAQSRAAS